MRTPLQKNLRRVLLSSIFCILLWSDALFALPTRPFSAGLGLGVPEFTFVEAQVMAFGRCQIGATFGALPVAGVIPQNIEMSERTVTLTTGDAFTVVPKVSPSFYLLSPFLRVFPSKNNNFYVQGMLSILKMNASITGDFHPRDNPSLPTIPLTGNVSITQLMPTFSVGYIFSSQIYYFNLGIGVSYMMNPSTYTTIAANVPDSLGGSGSNAVPLDEFNGSIETSVINSSREVRDKYGIFPSMHISFGIYF